MELKEIKPINFLFFRTDATINGLRHLLPIAQELFEEAVKFRLTITGPVQWHYFGFDGNPYKPFTLEIALPVGEVLEEYDGKFHFKRSEPFNCVSMEHRGNWFDMPQTYGKLMAYIKKNKLQPISVNREVYINTDFKHPESNITEVQIGIATSDVNLEY